MAWNINLPTTQYLDLDAIRAPGGGETLEALINELKDQKYIAIDTETTGLSVWKDLPLYWSLAWGNRRMTLNANILHYFQDVFKTPSITWLLANAKYDAHILANVGIELTGKMACIQLMHSLLYEELPHDLKFIANHILGWTWASFEDQFGKIGKKQSASDVIHRAEVANMSLLVEYAANDAYGTLNAGLELLKQLAMAKTHSLFRTSYPYIDTLEDLYWKTEVPYTRVLWKMEREGVRINKPHLDTSRPIAENDILRIQKDLNQLAGRVINPNSPDQVAKWLIEDLGLAPRKMTEGGKTGVRKPSVDESFLEFHKNSHPAAALLLEYRGQSKLLKTYINGLANWMDPDDRIHCVYHQDVVRCMPEGELILTNRGYLPIERVAVGDLVITHTGATKPVEDVSIHTPEPIYRVGLENGLFLRTNGAHPYLTDLNWVTANTLAVGQWVVVHSGAEAWLPILDWHAFEVSSWGRVYNKKTRRFLTQNPKGKWGHLKVCLYRNGAQHRGEDRKDFAVHQLVLKAHGTWVPGLETRHLNGIAWDNTLRNLQCGTSQENREDALKHGTMSPRRAGRTKLTEEAVERIRSLGSPGQPPSCNTKLSYELAEEIRTAYAKGHGRAELARKHGVSYGAVDNIIKDKSWTNPRTGTPTAEELAEEYGVSSGTIRGIWAGRCWQDEDYIEGKKATFYYARVTSVSIEAAEPTYGLTVADDHSHVTGGIVTHNTGRLSSRDPNLFWK